jgi:hypothetical protein
MMQRGPAYYVFLSVVVREQARYMRVKSKARAREGKQPCGKKGWRASCARQTWHGEEAILTIELVRLLERCFG